MLGHEFTHTTDEPGAVTPDTLAVARFEVARASVSLSRGIPMCPGALAFLASAGCHPDLLTITGTKCQGDD